VSSSSLLSSAPPGHFDDDRLLHVPGLGLSIADDPMALESGRMAAALHDAVQAPPPGPSAAAGAREPSGCADAAEE
jgi:hypothetical protein